MRYEEGQELRRYRSPIDEPAVLLVGSYAGPDLAGIHTYVLDPGSGALREHHETGGVPFPAYVVPSPRRPWAYAVSETTACDRVGPGSEPAQAGRAGSVWALVADADGLHPVRNRASGGELPTHLAIAPSGRWLAVSNYGCGAMAGSLAIFGIDASGDLGERAALSVHSGSGPVVERQATAHVHSSVFTPEGSALVAADLGADRLIVYRFDNRAGSVRVEQECDTPAGWGPRYLHWSKDAKTLFVVGELAAEVASYAYDADRMRLELLATVPTTTRRTSQAVMPSDIHLSPDGRLLYVANRGGMDGISLIHCAEPGHLSIVAETSTYGAWPRDFALSPDGRMLVVANQHSNSLDVLGLDGDGRPADHLSTTACDAVSSVSFW